MGMVLVAALGQVRLEYRWPCFFELEEGIAVILAQKKNDEAARADAADSDHLPGDIDHPISAEEGPPIVLQAAEVGGKLTAAGNAPRLSRVRAFLMRYAAVSLVPCLVWAVAKTFSAETWAYQTARSPIRA